MTVFIYSKHGRVEASKHQHAAKWLNKQMTAPSTPSVTAHSSRRFIRLWNWYLTCSGWACTPLTKIRFTRGLLSDPTLLKDLSRAPGDHNTFHQLWIECQLNLFWDRWMGDNYWCTTIFRLNCSKTLYVKSAFGKYQKVIQNMIDCSPRQHHDHIPQH